MEGRRQPSNIIRTFAHKLASFDAQIRMSIAMAIDKAPKITQLSLSKVGVEPLLNVPSVGTNFKVHCAYPGCFG